MTIKELIAKVNEWRSTKSVATAAEIVEAISEAIK